MIRKWLREDRPDWLRIVRLLRYEASMILARAQALSSARQWRLGRNLRGAHDLKLQLGSGPWPVPGWVNIDTSTTADMQFDIRRSWPLGNGTAAYIFTEHVLDHLAFPHGIDFVLRECHRVLKKSGVMRAVVHDAELLLRAYLNKDIEFFRRVGALTDEDENTSSPIAYVNHIFRFNGFHQFIYDWEMLDARFRKAGFSVVRRSSFRGSTIKDLNLDLDLPDRAPQSIYLEAIK